MLDTIELQKIIDNYGIRIPLEKLLNKTST